jgi:hypothetical protein
MEKISAKEFLRMITENPSGFEHWDTPLEITEYVQCWKSAITHLSKYLTFSGKDSENNCADFSYSPNLQLATGTFQGFVWFTNTNVKKIEELTITETDKNGWTASFENCQNLEIATGTYPGFVSFLDSGIRSIQNLHIDAPNEIGNYANFENCHYLQNLKGWDPSKAIWIEPYKLAAEKERRALQKFHKETQPQELPFL